MALTRRTSRRALLRGAGAIALGGAAAALAACGDTPPAASESLLTATGTPLAQSATAAPGAEPGSEVRAREPFRLVQPPSTTIAGAATTIALPPELVRERDGRLVNVSGHEFGVVELWKSQGWTTNFALSLVPYEDILSGGVVRDGIPPIDEPKFVAPADADAWLAGREPVIALSLGGEQRAYPLQILTQHEIVNDVVGGRPVAVTFCPLCNSSVVFDREVFGAILRFGVSGNLHNSDLIMWDNLTESWWQQLTGEGIVGELAGVRLQALPSQLIAYDEFKAAFPQGLVLSRDTGFARRYGLNPYAGLRHHRSEAVPVSRRFGRPAAGHRARACAQRGGPGRGLSLRAPRKRDGRKRRHRGRAGGRALDPRDRLGAGPPGDRTGAGGRFGGGLRPQPGRSRS